jgi:hypothetical protein
LRQQTDATDLGLLGDGGRRSEKAQDFDERDEA